MLITQERLDELLSKKGNAGIKKAIDHTATKTALNKINVVPRTPPEKIPASELATSHDVTSDMSQITEMLRSVLTRLLAVQAEKDEFNRNFIPGTPVSEPRARLHPTRAQKRENPAPRSGVFAGVLGGGAGFRSKGSGGGFAGTLFRPRARKAQTEPIPDRLASALETARMGAQSVKEFAQRHGKIKQDSLSDVFGSSMR